MTPTNKARVVADLSQGIILGTVDIAAPPERVFRALSTAEVTEWWGSADTYRTTEWTSDVRPGGAWRAGGVGADGKPFAVHGEYVEVDPPRRLVQTWRADWDPGHATRLTYQLEPIDGGTRVTLWHDGFAGRPQACAGHTDGWERVLGWLRGRFAAGPELRYFLVRLLAPRATFMVDMTADERAMMQEHVVYWTGLAARGTAVVFGPVADPAGGWGLGVIRAADEAEMHALRDADPAIRSGRGFRYEILPMLRAVTAG